MSATPQELNQWSRDTGQNTFTLQYYRPVINIGRLDRRTYPTTNHRVLYFVSKKLQYTKTQLISFQPDNPQLKIPPLYGYPPPNLLLGYKPLIDVVSSRPFDSTTITQFTYHPIKRLGVVEQMQWSVLSSSDVNTDVSEYGNLVDIESWESNADQVDVQNIRETRNRLLINRLVNNERNMAGSGANHIEAMTSTKLLNDVRIAAFNYAMLSTADVIIPTVEDYLDEENNWISRLIENFSSTRWQEWIPADMASPINAVNIAAQAMTLGDDNGSNASSLWELTGGAMRLRSGRLIGSPYNLRGPRRYPIYSRGRTNDSNTRRRLAADYVNRRLNRESTPIEDRQQTDEEDDEQYENDTDEFHMEIMRLLEEIARQAASQSSPTNRYMNFPDKFYAALRSHIAESVSYGQETNPSFIKAWLINYLISEQISQILNIISSKLTPNNFPKPIFCQVVITAKNSDEKDLFKRIWTTTERPYDMFLPLFNRIINDLVSSLNMILNQPDINQIREETEAMLIESGMSDVSGSIVDVLEQVTSYEQIESITVSIKLKCRGIVAYSTNETIVNAFKRWMSLQIQNYERPTATARRQITDR